MSDKLHIKTATTVLRSAPEVFEAILDPGQMSQYFISTGSGRMEEGKEVTWKFPEYEMKVLVEVKKVVSPSLISFRWEGEPGAETRVEMKWDSQDDGASTKVTVTEGELPNDETGIRWLKRNTEGWANFLACLKAWMEFGINLRKGKPAD